MGQGGRAVDCVNHACGLRAARSVPISSPPPAPDVNGYTPEPLATATVGGRDAKRRRAALRPRSRSAGTMVDAVSFQGAQQPGREGARRQSRSAGGAGSARVARENVYVQAGRAVARRRRQFHRHPAKVRDRPALRRRLGLADLQSLHRAVEHFLYARRVRRHAALHRIAGGAGGFATLHARGDLSDLDFQSRRRRGAGGLATRPDRGDAKHHQDRDRRAVAHAQAIRVSARSPRPTSWRRRRRSHRSSRRCRRCKSNWRNSATCWRR